jgi:hypothetical protein
MSCQQFLDDVQLITKQEVEAMLNAAIVPESRIEEIVASEREMREASEDSIRTSIDQERETRVNEKLELDDKISDEADLRSRADAGLAEDIHQEEEKRKQADTDLVHAIEDMREFEEEDLPNVHCRRLKGLPIAEMTVHNTDKSLHIGDTIATVDEKWFPKIAYDFWMDVEQIDDTTGTSKTALIHCRLDNDGNINVINMIDGLLVATSATDVYTFMYLTEA